MKNPEEETSTVGKKAAVRKIAPVAALVAVPLAILLGGFAVASGFSAAGHAMTALETSRGYDELAVQKLIDKQPWYEEFLAAPVWESPEFERIAAAQSADEAELFASVKDEALKEAGPLPGTRWVMNRLLKDYVPDGITASAPLDTATATSMPVLQAMSLGYEACKTGNIYAFAADLENTPVPLMPGDSPKLRDAWAEGAPLVVSAAAEIICGSGAR